MRQLLLTLLAVLTVTLVWGCTIPPDDPRQSPYRQSQDYGNGGGGGGGY